MFHKVTHVIFDLDGLILDTEYIYDKVIQDIASKYGKIYTLAARMKVKGTPEHDTAATVISELELPMTSNEFLEIYKKACEEELKNPPILPGAEKLIRHLSENKIPIAIATSGSASITETKTQNHKELFSLFSHVVMGSTDPEVKNGKPNPDIFLICCARFPDKPDPEQCLVLEDAPNGVMAALKAGMQVVMVPAEEVNEELCEDATLVLNSLVEFKPELFDLPPYD